MTRLPRPATWVRVYLVLFVALRFGLFAITYAVSKARITTTSSTFDVVTAIAPLETFIILFAVISILAMGGALFPRNRATRLLLWLSSSVSLLFGLGLLFSWSWSPAIAGMIPAAFADAIVSGKSYRSSSRQDL